MKRVETMAQGLCSRVDEAEDVVEDIPVFRVAGANLFLELEGLSEGHGLLRTLNLILCEFQGRLTRLSSHTRRAPVTKTRTPSSLTGWASMVSVRCCICWNGKFCWRERALGHGRWAFPPEASLR
jgi:hypothetical protein